MGSTKFDFPKLKGEENYPTWSIRAEASLIREGCIDSLSDIVEEIEPHEGSLVSSNATPTPALRCKLPTDQRLKRDQKGLATLKLIVEDGPLSHISRAKSLGEAWLILKTFCDKEGFSAIFILIKKFIGIKSSKTKVGPYLNEIRTLVNDLEAKGVKLPETFVNAWVLERLDKSYDDLKTAIYSSYRDNSNAYTLEQLSSHIMDEFRRRKSISDSSEEEEKAFVAFKKWKKAKKAGSKKRWCDHCEVPSHKTNQCWVLHPSLRPKKTKDRVEKPLQQPSKATQWKAKQPKPLKEEALVALSTEQAEESNPLEELNPLAESNSLIDLDTSQDWGNDSIDLNLDLSPMMDVDEVITLTSTNDDQEERITKSSLLDLINHIESAKDAVQGSRLMNNKERNCYASNFIHDNGATSHIVTDRRSFYSYNEVNKVVHWGSARSIRIQGIGNVYIQFKDTGTKMLLRNVLHVPELGVNLINQSKMTNHYSFLTPTNVVFINQHSGKIATIGDMINGLYYLPVRVLKPVERVFNTQCGIEKESKSKKPVESADIQLVHQRMGHLNLKALNKLQENTLGYKITKKKGFNIDTCPACNEAKMIIQRHKVPLSNAKKLDYLDKVASDICGPISPFTHDGYKYFITFLDKKTRYLVVKLLKHKSDALKAFVQFRAVAENNKGNKRIHVLATDQGREYVNEDFQITLENLGVIHQMSPAYTKESNGLIERPNRTLLNKVRATIYTANLPRKFWGDALMASVYIYNRTPHSALNYKTPFEAKNGRKPILSNIKIFGSPVYYKNNKPLKKLDKRGKAGILIGFGEEANLYKVWDTESSKALWSRDVKVFEYLTPYYDTSQNTTNSSIPGITSYSKVLQKDQRDKNKAKDPQRNGPEKGSGPEGITTNQRKTGQIPKGRQIYISLPRKSKRLLSQYQPVTELAYLARDNFADNNVILITSQQDEPKTFQDAVHSFEKDKWFESMKAEIDELQAQRTYTITKLPPGKHALGGRWVYKRKTNSLGQVIKYKSRWVVQGFRQILGLDYLETFSTTCRPEVYRLILILAVNQDWFVGQYDVKNAFVHAKIDREIYVIQPKGFEKDPSKVCRLHKALYGLKQSPRLWYKHLAEILKKEGFIVFPYDEGVFVHIEKQIIIACHVDDLLVVAAKEAVAKAVLGNIAKAIKLQYMGEISTFLGSEFEIDRENRSIQIHQRKYTHHILEMYNKLQQRGVTTPYQAGVKLTKSKLQASQEEITDYQRQIGSLLYLALKTRPDITFSVIKCSRYMTNPDHTHFKALDRIWQYLKQYPDLGLYYKCNESLLLKVYCDSDWASSLEDRKSTQAFITILGLSPINWTTKLQKSVALSSTEAEYMALKGATQEAIYINNMLQWWAKNLNIRKCCIQYKKPTILVDNLGAKDLSHTSQHHEKTKHIDIAYHFTRNCIKEGKVTIVHIPDRLQLADPLTKGVFRPKLQWFLDQIELKTIKGEA